MSLNWLDYEPYVPPYRGPLAALGRAQAKESFAHWMEARPERWRQLGHLLEGTGIELGGSDSQLQTLNDWFRSSVEAKADDPTRLANRWYAVVNDVSGILGDVLIGRCSGLRWEMFIRGGKSDIAFQKPVITGFTRVPNLKFNLDLDRLVSTYAHQIIGGNDVDSDQFLTILQVGQSKA